MLLKDMFFSLRGNLQAETGIRKVVWLRHTETRCVLSFLTVMNTACVKWLKRMLMACEKPVKSGRGRIYIKYCTTYLKKSTTVIETQIASYYFAVFKHTFAIRIFDYY